MKRSLTDELTSFTADSSLVVKPLHPVAEAIQKLGNEMVAVQRDLVGISQELAQGQLELANAQQELEAKQPVPDGAAVSVDDAGRLLGCRRTKVFELIRKGL